MNEKPEKQISIALVMNTLGSGVDSIADRAAAARWLVARRFDDAHLGGSWEFPGGKREPGETAAEAAVRELYEECGVIARPLRELAPIRFDYGDRIVVLTPVICRWEIGEARPLGSQECRWVLLDELLRLEMPAANEHVIRELKDALAQD